LLGEKQPTTRDGETYQGWTGAPLLDLFHGVFAAMNSGDLPDVLVGLRTILDASPGVVAGTMRELDRIDEARARHPEGAFAPHHAFEDDLLAVLQEIVATPGLLKAMLDALADPASRGMTNVFKQMMKYKKDRVSEADVAAGNVFTTPVD